MDHKLFGDQPGQGWKSVFTRPKLTNLLCLAGRASVSGLIGIRRVAVPVVGTHMPRRPKEQVDLATQTPVSLDCPGDSG